MKLPHARPAIALILGLAFSAGAWAQYVWIDANNVRHYSDRPPPSDVPQKRILKAPPSAAALQAADAPASDKQSVAPKVPAVPTLAEKNVEFQKRRTEAAEKEKKDAETARSASERKTICERARSNALALESGERLTRADANGQRADLTDAQRAQELAEVRKINTECK